MAKNEELVFGIHAVNALINAAPERFIEIWLLKGREDDRIMPIINLSRKYGIGTQLASRKALDEKSEGEQHQGVIARVRPGKSYTENDIDDIILAAEKKSIAPFFLILDGVTDPHNLGACLRNADAAGVQAIIVPKDNAAQITPTVRKVAVGAVESVPLVQVTNLSRTMKQLQKQGVWIVGTAGETDTCLYDVKLSGPMALVMGAEGKGMRRLTRENCDQLVKLPMAGTVSSLNVSVATGICLFEMVRQRSI
ncbi:MULTISPECIES: 23S rRNA (guanosine(2251)-2'-O)-methyltransferase RlmB [Colwellia]|uniref:23S rRNA (guanosine-2'-O-)-methyltransferase RlmB n=1 Tax=Colwellia psychrerythraea (strain 34H / ATCC BAA-681) TaxID=167879 RepID=Q47VA9_COLP3|nr:MULTISPECIES: 23S rRNA (guanosine(2251)-2'-O)-methyltransferase RlmB [Colwellia]AAZ28331.1 RNA methyltransferase, TrmH family, group 3 [Colwellia psychrerythraea 34H]PKH85742.1 23S rRNA (guanosine(2251)-2'-O)-methyltransferase RlmB [Colwellia sp. Bg11-28]